MQYSQLYGSVFLSWVLLPLLSWPQLTAIRDIFLELSTHTHDNAGHVALGFCVPMLSDLCWLLLFILHSSPEK